MAREAERRRQGDDGRALLPRVRRSGLVGRLRGGVRALRGRAAARAEIGRRGAHARIRPRATSSRRSTRRAARSRCPCSPTPRMLPSSAIAEVEFEATVGSQDGGVIDAGRPASGRSSSARWTARGGSSPTRWTATTWRPPQRARRGRRRDASPADRGRSRRSRQASRGSASRRSRRRPPRASRCCRSAMPTPSSLRRSRGTSPIFILILGSDSRPGTPMEEGSATRSTSSGSTRATKRATLVGIPRDSYVPIATGGTNKINVRARAGRPAGMIATVENLTGDHVRLLHAHRLRGDDEDLRCARRPEDRRPVLVRGPRDAPIVRRRDERR